MHASFYVLKSFSEEDSYFQKEHKEEIITVFKQFWDTCPSEKEFSECTMGLLLFPAMLHYMNTNHYSST